MTSIRTSSVSPHVISRTTYPSLGQLARARHQHLFAVSTSVHGETCGNIAHPQGTEGAALACELSDYSEFLSAFTAREQVFTFDAAGTCVDLSGKRDVSLQQG